MYLANNKWLKYVKMILVTAEEFGYGPIITAIYFLEQVNNYKHIECVFAGKGLSLVQPKKSDLFVECVECDLKDNDQIINFLNNRSDINTIISFENLESIIVGVHKHLKTIYIDNLFWMWKSIPEELNRVDNYIIVDSFGNLDENLSRIGKKIKNKTIIGPLRNVNQKTNKDSELNKSVLIGLGGADSYLMNKPVVYKFYEKLVLQIGNNVNEILGDLEINVCGGDGIIKFLKTKIQNSKYSFRTMTHNNFLKLMSNSRYVFLTPGLGNFFESTTLEQEVCFLLPINYSQYWQCEYYKKMNRKVWCINWNNLFLDCKISQYLEESEGVFQVEENIQRYMLRNDAQLGFETYIDDYIRRSIVDKKNINRIPYSEDKYENFYTKIIGMLE